MPERSPYDTSAGAQQQRAFAESERRLAEQQKAEAARRAAAQRDEESGAIYPWEREQQAARESLRQRSEAAVQRSRQVDPTQQVAQAGEEQFGQALQMLGMRQTGRAPRPFHRPTKEFTEKMQGGFEEQVVMDPETGQPMVRQRVDPRTGEPMVDASGQPVSEIVTETVRRPGLLEQQRAADEQVMQARVQREQQVADVLDEQNRRQEMALVDMQARQHAQSERQLAQVEQVKQANQAAQNAADAFAQAPSLETFMQSKTAGQRIRIALASGMLGAAGRNPMEMIGPLMQNELDVAKSNLALRQQKLGVRQQQVQQERNLYGDIMAQVQDERMADAIYQKSMLQAMQSEAQAKLQQAGVQTMTAEQQAMLNQLDQQIAAKTMEIQKVAEANTPMVTVSRSPFSGAQRRMIEKAGLEGLERSSEAQKIGLQQAGKREIEGMKMQGDAAKQREHLMRGEGGVYREAKQYADDAADAEGLIRQIDEILAQEDISGFGSLAGSQAITPGGITTDKKLKNIIEAFGRMQSGAAITDEEEERFADMITGGTNLGGEERLRKNLEGVRNMARGKIETYERALSPEAREYVRRNKALADFQPESTGSVNAPSVVRVDE